MNVSYFRNAVRSFAVVIFVLTFPIVVSAQEIDWQRAGRDFHIARYELSQGNTFLSAQILLLKFSPTNYQFKLVQASDLSLRKTNVERLTESIDGTAGINAHFYDPEGKPLGLLAVNGEFHQAMHRGGKLLTGVFYIKNRIPRIVHRSNFNEASPNIALQAGPRLIANSKPLKLSNPDATSRRSGIAITKTKDVIIFATTVRFPGTSLKQIQELLLKPELLVTDALNLDGGGSSQLFIEENEVIDGETSISGGDDIPVALAVLPRR